MPGKRQHYVPQFMLRRFAMDPADRRSMRYRRDPGSGTPQKVNPRNETVEHHYYRIETEDGEHDDSADALLDRFEDEAAKRIRPLVSDARSWPPDMDVFWLANFFATLKLRTPEGREQLHEMDIRIAELDAELRFSDPGQLPKSFPEEERLKVLDDLRAGRIGFDSTKSREVALMFAGLESVAEFPYEHASWTICDAPASRRFVLSDHPVAHFDPTPKVADAGWSFASSPNAVTVIQLDPAAVLAITPSDAPTFGRRALRRRKSTRWTS